MFLFRARLLFLALLFAPCSAFGWEGAVVRVCDGDTIIVAREGQDGSPEQVCVRLYGIDAPETSGHGRETQPYGKASRRFLSDLLASGRVAVIDLGTDKYARIIGGVVSLPEGAVVQEELLKAGLAWVYPRYCRDCRRWRLLEEEAKAARVGVWRDADPVPPWEWRKRGRKKGRETTAWPSRDTGMQ